MTINILLILVFILRVLTVIVGEGANFAAYAYAPAILVTPLGALSIIFRYSIWHHCPNLKKTFSFK